jgi:opacity protein-like surface antigen
MKRTLALLAAFAGGPAAAQDWSFEATLYGWIPGLDVSLDTDLGEIESESSGSDALEDLDMAFMGTFEARTGRWGFVGDLLYADLSTSEDTPFGLAYSDAEVGVRVSAFSGYAAYRVHESPDVSFDIAGGFRAFSLDIETSLDSAGRARDRDFSNSETWAVPLVGARLIVPFGDRWFGTAFADVGALADDSSTWQALGTVGYLFDERWSAQLGYRYMNLEKDVDGRDVSVGLSGPIIGVSARF